MKCLICPNELNQSFPAPQKELQHYFCPNNRCNFNYAIKNQEIVHYFISHIGKNKNNSVWASKELTPFTRVYNTHLLIGDPIYETSFMDVLIDNMKEKCEQLVDQINKLKVFL